MKTYLTLLLLLFGFGIASAQTVTTQPVTVAPTIQHAQPIPLYIIYSHDKIVAKSDTSLFNLKGLNTADIETINVLKNTSAVKKYGDEGKNSVVEIYLKDTAVFNKDMSKGKGN